jgi:cyclic pyranopterin phosphate synthase
MAEDVTFLSRQEVLTIEEIIKLIDVFNELGVKKFRLTGGEPLVRKNIISVIEHLFELKKQNKILEHTLTTNGTNLEKYSPILKKNGIDRINVSLDSLSPEKFKKITKWGNLEKVINGIRSAITEGIKVKINTVLTQDFNDDEIFEIIDWCKKNSCDISLIEVMPIGSIGEKRFDQYLSMKTFEEKLVKKLELIPSKYRTNGPSRYFTNSQNDQKIGIISAISHNFCDTCNRVRLTCTGKLYMCLGQNDFVDLKFALRNQSKADIIKLIEYAMSIKPKSHNFEINKNNYEGYVDRYMNETGG